MTEGAYGIIFINRALGSIIKVYKRGPDEDHLRDVFRAETDAYSLAGKSEEVSDLIPGNFHLRPPVVVIDSRGRDVTGEFFPDLVFEADFVEGNFKKIGSINSTEAFRVRKLFHEAGIHHTTDMSVTVSSYGTVQKVIDFALREYELMHRE